MSNASAENEKEIINLKHGSKIANRWFIGNGMLSYPEKLQLMVMSYNDIGTRRLDTDDTT